VNAVPSLHLQLRQRGYVRKPRTVLQVVVDGHGFGAAEAVLPQQNVITNDRRRDDVATAASMAGAVNWPRGIADEGWWLAQVAQCGLRLARKGLAMKGYSGSGEAPGRRVTVRRPWFRSYHRRKLVGAVRFPLNHNIPTTGHPLQRHKLTNPRSNNSHTSP
jgi:hypothetical protein